MWVSGVWGAGVLVLQWDKKPMVLTPPFSLTFPRDSDTAGK